MLEYIGSDEFLGDFWKCGELFFDFEDILLFRVIGS